MATTFQCTTRIFDFWWYPCPWRIRTLPKYRPCSTACTEVRTNVSLLSEPILLVIVSLRLYFFDVYPPFQYLFHGWIGRDWWIWHLLLVLLWVAMSCQHPIYHILRPMSAAADKWDMHCFLGSAHLPGTRDSRQRTYLLTSMNPFSYQRQPSTY